jgi:hypothetical protein
MTSEVVVMNRLGVALASDSTATVYSGRRPKFFHADKLFMLSHRHPVGVMVYNNSSLLGVPWETILKMFRSRLGSKEFDTLEGYSTELLGYLNNNVHLFPETEQVKFYLRLVDTLYSGLRSGIARKILDLVPESGEDATVVARQATREIVLGSQNEWRSRKDATCFDTKAATQWAAHQSGEINKLIAKHFENADAEVAHALHDLATLIVAKDQILPESLSGLVIAGFGGSEYFPVMQAFELGEIFGGKLKYQHKATEKVGSDNPSVVKPFAQVDMVQTFLNGVSPSFEYKLTRELLRLGLGLPDAVIDELEGISKKRKEQFKEKIRPIISRDVMMPFIRRLAEFRNARHLQPVRQAIAFLPKNELAHVASSLVNLNSFQKRMSISEDETVGGPIDVAVISKGDGFVWIERKHYFKPELNHHFFRNYGRVPGENRGGDQHGAKQEGGGDG